MGELIEKIWSFVNAPELLNMWSVLVGYLIAYLAALALTRVIIPLRRGSTPSIKTVAHSTTLFVLLLHTLLPVYFILEMIVRQYFTSEWYLAPYVVVAILNIVVFINIIGKVRSRRAF